MSKIFQNNNSFIRKHFKSVIVIFLLVIVALVLTIPVSSSENAANNSENILNQDKYKATDENKILQTASIQDSQPFPIKLSFVGDLMLAEYKDANAPGRFNSYANSKPATYFLENVVYIFEVDDFTIGNLENVLSDNSLSPVAKSGRAFWFKSKTSNTNILTSSSVEVVSLANNHYGDYGTQGRKDTVQAVTNAGLEYGWNDKTVYLEKNGFKIALICHGLWSEWQANEIINRINEAESQSDFQIVYFHGGTEGIHSPEQWKRNACHKMVDVGADMIIGNHPHVLQPREYYNGVSIIYSLGNFCYGGSMSPENRTIIYQYTIWVNPDTLEITNKESNIIPCYVYTGNINNFQPDIITGEDQKQKVIDFMNWKVKSPV